MLNQRDGVSRGVVRCPKCHGRLARHRDTYGAYLSCLVCGFTRDLVSRATILLEDDEPPDTAAADHRASHRAE